MPIHGRSLLAVQLGALGGTMFRAHNPASNEELSPPFHSASLAEADQAV